MLNVNSFFQVYESKPDLLLLLTTKPIAKPQCSNKMSNQNQQSSYASYSSTSYSSSSTQNGQQTTGSHYAQQSYTDPSGTTVRSASQNLGEAAVTEERRYDSQGQQLVGGSESKDLNRRIEDVSDDQREKDKEYLEKIEDEYAKREGGA